MKSENVCPLCKCEYPTSLDLSMHPCRSLKLALAAEGLLEATHAGLTLLKSCGFTNGEPTVAKMQKALDEAEKEQK